MVGPPSGNRLVLPLRRAAGNHGVPGGFSAGHVHIRTQVPPGWFARVGRASRYVYHRVIRQPGSPEYVAKGIALGVATALFLPFGQVPVVLLLAIVCRASKPAALIATLPINPVTGTLIYPLEYARGCALLDISALGSLPTSWQEFAEFVSLRQEDLPVLWAFLLGSGLCAIASLPVVYYTSCRAIVAYRHWKQKRRTAKAAAAAIT